MTTLWCALSFIGGGILATLFVARLIKKNFIITRKEKEQ